MRIDFKSTFQDLQRLIDRPGKSSTEPPEKVATLASISPFDSQLIENMKKTGVPAVSQPLPPEDIRARYSFPDPLIEVPKPEMLQVPSSEAIEVKEEPISVKSPTIVSARRITPEQAFSDLSKTERMDEVQKLVQSAAKKHGIDPLLSMSVVSAESSFNPLAISSDGHASKGLMQLLDSTGKDLHARLGNIGPYTPFDPNLNIDLGVSYLRRLHDLFSESTQLPNKSMTVAAANSSSLEKLALAAFNAGEGRVASAQARAERAGKDPSEYDQIAPYLPETTQKYVRRVVSLKSQFEESFEG